ncbi:Dehydrogenases with different specificities (related to short-chain alcohol dehydrogenases) [Paenibacillus uliginis N3/975]|uniref:Dehydrogenases with different specificities (Related to short-chain alcohol dehydrogenases) n=1 Tax=Paenibacillus uliginis N3/975 TaxID=1313296 RepID=A0A1X7HSH3_9BACL|nr:SDR family NAD(P)-dependent oxidoreductase [Paenibacillus uliginis]SMF91102.1 Dehydrogenases with different specificities (related to short-chain alcohol dehydrogenases) [Paenibacillus uliginis N3/975]
MKTILVTGGTDGIGKGVATHFLKKDDRVIVVGSSSAKGDLFLNEARQLGAEGRAIFLQANLSLVNENKRIIEEVKSRFHSLDRVVFCATNHKPRKEYSETPEGFEFSFGLSYLSRFALSYGLKELLENSDNPVILNVCAPGMNGTVNLDDIQNKNNYNGAKARYHGSRLNDLLGVAFAHNDTIGKIKYILFNPWAVQTTGTFEAYENPVTKSIMKLIYKTIGKPVEEAIFPIIELLENPPKPSLSAYKQRKEVSLAMKTFDKENAQKLLNITVQMLEAYQKNI